MIKSFFKNKESKYIFFFFLKTLQKKKKRGGEYIVEMSRNIWGGYYLKGNLKIRLLVSIVV